MLRLLFFNGAATTWIYTSCHPLSLPDALPFCWAVTYGSATIPADAPAVTPDPKAAQGAALAAPTPSPVRLEAKTDGDDWNVALTTSERNNGQIGRAHV